MSNMFVRLACISNVVDNLLSKSFLYFVNNEQEP